MRESTDKYYGSWHPANAVGPILTGLGFCDVLILGGFYHYYTIVLLKQIVELDDLYRVAKRYQIIMVPNVFAANYLPQFVLLKSTVRPYLLIGTVLRVPLPGATCVKCECRFDIKNAF